MSDFHFYQSHILKLLTTLIICAKSRALYFETCMRVQMFYCENTNVCVSCKFKFLERKKRNCPNFWLCRLDFKNKFLGFVQDSFSLWSPARGSVDSPPVITVPIQTHVGVFGVVMHRLTAQAFLLTPSTTQTRHQDAIKSLLHYSKLRQTPAPLRLGEWDH